MMMHREIATVVERLFVPQTKLEEWLEDGRVSFNDNVLTLEHEQATYHLLPAVKVISVIDGDDVAKLVGQVLTVSEVSERDGEHCRDSIIIGDCAYQCEEGYAGDAPASPKTPALPSVAEPQSTVTEALPNADKGGEETKTDTDLLAEFMLKHL